MTRAERDLLLLIADMTIPLFYGNEADRRLETYDERTLPIMERHIKAVETILAKQQLLSQVRQSRARRGKQRRKFRQSKARHAPVDLGGH